MSAQEFSFWKFKVVLLRCYINSEGQKYGADLDEITTVALG